MKHTEQFIRQRKFYVMLPLLVLPFITLIFWALGGGKAGVAEAAPVMQGLNAALPAAKFEEQDEIDRWDKFSLYEKAARDSTEHETARENDPYFDLVAFGSEQEDEVEKESKLIGTFKQKDRLIDANEEKVSRKLEQLYAEINRASTSSAQQQSEYPEPEVQPIARDPQEIAALESMMEQIQHEKLTTEPDPEINQLDAMLEKIMDVQHPERVRDRLAATKTSNAPQNFNVQALPDADYQAPDSSYQETGHAIDSVLHDTVTFAPHRQPSTSGPEILSTTIHAIIHETQTVTAGSMVRLRLLNDVTINGQKFPQDNFLYGTASINGERLAITISSVVNTDTQSLLPVSLAVYDLDGLEGIYIPGAITRDAARQASDEAVQSVQLMSFDQSIGAQAASAGIEATKGLLSKKAKLITVTVKAGHKVFLLNKQ